MNSYPRNGHSRNGDEEESGKDNYSAPVLEKEQKEDPRFTEKDKDTAKEARRVKAKGPDKLINGCDDRQVVTGEKVDLVTLDLNVFEQYSPQASEGKRIKYSSSCLVYF